MKRLIQRFGLILICFSALGASAAHADQVYRDSELRLSFRYPDRGTSVPPQLSTTRVLLYASDGSQGTCNVSATLRRELTGLPTEQLHAYNAANHSQRDLEASLQSMFPDLQTINFWRGTLG